MMIKDIAKRYGVDSSEFVAWLKSSNVRTKTTVLKGLEVDDSEDMASVMAQYEAHLVAARQAADEAAAADVVKRRELSKMLITSGFNFDGFTITKYSGYISGDDAVQIDRGRGGLFNQTTNVGDSLLKSLVHIRRNALTELKEAAYDLGCNAVIGVDFDYLILDPETVNSNGGTLYLPYVFGVTANGNAVVIERNGESQTGSGAVPVGVPPVPPLQPSAAVEGSWQADPMGLQTNAPTLGPNSGLPARPAAGPSQLAPQPPAQPAAPEAGSWQADPTGQHRLRWWDGLQWTDFTQD